MNFLTKIKNKINKNTNFNKNLNYNDFFLIINFNQIIILKIIYKI